MVKINDITPVGQHYLVRTAAHNICGSTDIADYPPTYDAPNGDDSRPVGTAEFTASAAGLGGLPAITLGQRGSASPMIM